MPVIIAAAAIALLAALIIRKLRHGGSCCGEHESTAAKVSAEDRDISHYPYRYRIGIEGMVCAGCVRNAENAFNSREGIMARAELKSKTAVMYSKHRLERREAAELLSGTSYTLTDFREVKE